MKLTKDILARQLTGAVQGPYDVERIDQMRNDLNARGEVFLARDRLEYIYRRRLKGCQANDPHGLAVSVCETVLSNLADVGENETLHSWTIRKDGRRIDGFSTEMRLVVVFPESFTNRDDELKGT